MTGDTESIHGGGWVAGVPASLVTVPANLGIRSVRVTANIAWANNSVGVRQVYFQHNSANFAGQSRVDRAASGLSNTNIVSPIIDVADGDTIRVIVFQDSGRALNVGSGNNPWLAVEVVD